MAGVPERFARVLWPMEAPIDEGRANAPELGPPERPPDVPELEARIAHPLSHIAATLDAIRDELAPESGRPFSLINGAVAAASGVGDVIYDGPRPGNLWRVELVYVSVAAAAAAGIVEVFVDTAGEENVAGFLANLNGNSPSRGFLALPRPAVVFGGQPFIVRLSGVPAAAQITCRIQGENQVLGGD